MKLFANKKQCHSKITKQTGKNILRSILFSSLVLLTNTLLINIQLANASEREGPAWYEIEIIVFKPTRERNFLDESWNTDIEINKPENLIDLLKPEKKSGLSNKQTSTNKQTLQSYPKPSNKSINSNPINNPDPNNKIDTQDVQNLSLSIIDINSLEEEARQLNQLIKKTIEKPFVLLSDELKQLTNEAKSLERHPEYKVLKHIAWRQPVENFRKSPHIRIIGGTDFNETYDHTGNRHETELLTESELSVLAEEKKQDKKNTGETSKNMPSNDKVFDELSVPELDGDIKIYIKKFLHLRTNLFLRKPGQEEVKASNDSLYDSESLSSIWTSEIKKKESLYNLNKANLDSTLDATDLNTNNPDSNSSILNDATLNNSISNDLTLNKLSSQNPQSNENVENLNQQNILQENTNPLQSLEQQDQFSWELNDNFLDMQPEKIYIEKLFNYSLKQSRRIKSNELHYLDHPLLGLLIMIRPYERE